jgi:outer membrane receptor for ferrienterochelin and colicins
VRSSSVRRGVALALGLGLGLGLGETARASPLELSEIEDIEALSLTELLERPVIAASRYLQKPGSSPTLVSTVDADQIDRLGYRTLGEALRGVRGVYGSNDRNYSYIGVRGLSLPGDYNSRIALSIDDHGINDAVFQQAAGGLELGLPMIAIDRIEMIRGGAWSLYGQSALLGAIQIVTASGATRPGLALATTSRLGAETASDPAGRPTLAARGQDVQASYGAVGHGVDVFAAASYVFDRGLDAIYTPEFTDPSAVCVDHASRPRTCDGVVHGNDGEQAGSGYLVVRSPTWSAHALASRRHKDVATAPYNTLIDDPGDQTVDDRFYADVAYTRSSEHSDVIARIAANDYRYTGAYAYDIPRAGFTALPDSRTLDHYVAHAQWLSGELRGRYKIGQLGRYLSDIELALGGELGASRVKETDINAFPEGDGINYDHAESSRMVALSAQASVRMVERLVGFAAIRGDYYPDSFGTTINPQSGLVLDGGSLGRVRLSIARGFRAPNVYEHAYAMVGATLEPERSESRELSVERYLGDHLRAQLVGYSHRMTDLITDATTDSGHPGFANRNGIDALGVESELEGRWHTWRLRGSFAWQRSTDQDHHRLVNSPRALASGSLLAPIVDGRADFAAEAFFIGARMASNGSTVPAVLTTNLSVTARHVAGPLDVTLGVTNLFDRRDSDPGGQEHRQGLIPRDPRIVWLRLQLGLGR